jgi:putative flippase GtrA
VKNYHQIAVNFWKKHKEVLLWAIGGGINTAITYGMYLLLKIYFSYRVAFSASYIVGIIIAYYYNSLVVFKSPLSFKKFIQFPVVYLVQYLLNLGLLEVFVRVLRVNTTVAPIFVLIVVTPVTYFLSKVILKEKRDPRRDELD